MTIIRTIPNLINNYVQIHHLRIFCLSSFNNYNDVFWRSSNAHGISVMNNFCVCLPIHIYQYHIYHIYHHGQKKKQTDLHLCLLLANLCLAMQPVYLCLALLCLWKSIIYLIIVHVTVYGVWWCYQVHSRSVQAYLVMWLMLTRQFPLQGEVDRCLMVALK